MNGRDGDVGALRSVTGPLHLVGWRDPKVVALALVATAAGFGQFGATAALGDVARGFGRVVPGASLADQAGLSLSAIGLGLAVIRLASLGSLPLAGAADRLGRRRVMLATCALGLACTAAAALSPGYWWFIAVFALGRPFMSASAALAQVGAAEHTASKDRAKAIALVAAGYGVGAGLTAVLHGLGEGTLGFRGIFGLALVPLVLLPLIGRRITEPDRFAVAEAEAEHPTPVLGAVARPVRRRLAVVASLAFAVSVVTGPANSLTFLYAENTLHLPGAATAAMVVAAGVFGLAGLLVGRWLADHLGRRLTGALAMGAMCLCGAVAYSGSRPALFVGYELGVLAASTFAPAGGALANELFPTDVRASVAGWNVTAGVLGAA
ncbi:MAG TPA: MFS transporter, partial [Acidimicrobiales bacterium]|nr:MFS transporter [Acidimicrobiales bacterium]